MVNPVGTPLRGEVWLCAFAPPIGPHPAVVLTVNRIARPLSAVSLVLVTGTEGPEETHVPIGADCGVKKHPESYVNCTDLHTVDKVRLRRRLGLLSATELHSVENAIRMILGLN